MANSVMASPGTVPSGTKTSPPAKKKAPSIKSRAPVRPTPIPREGKQSEALTNMFQLLREGPMQTSQQGVPYRTIVGDPTQDPGYLRPPTRQDIEYGDRLQRAMKQKESGTYPIGIDPVLLEQRITAAERQPHGPGWEKDFGGPLRKDQYGPSTLQNVGDLVKSGYEATLGKMVPFAFLPGGGIWKSQWGNRPNEALPMRRSYIERGHGTLADSSRGDNYGRNMYLHKYYGQPEPVKKPRPRNVYDDLGMSQPTRHPPVMDVGQRDIPYYLTSGGKQAELDYGPAQSPPPGSEWGLPAGSLELQGLTTDPYLSKETRDLIRGGFPVENLPPKIQEYIKNTMEKPPSFIDLGGGPGEEEGKKKETFNILKFLLGLLGLPLKILGLTPPEEEEEKKKIGRSYQPQRQQIPWQAENRMNRQSYTARQKSITK